jgi:hypothetical protein
MSEPTLGSFLRPRVSEAPSGKRAENLADSAGDASVDVFHAEPEPISPTRVRRGLAYAFAIQGEDPVLAGERILRIIIESGLSPRQLSALDVSRSCSTLENLVFLAKLPREVHSMVRDHSLPPSAAQLIGRYLGDGPIELQIQAARSAVRHALTVAEVQRAGRIYRASHEFRFPA